jgi:hypothetical protein
MKSILLGLALILSLPAGAFGLGEVFKIETTGSEFCGDLDVQQFNANNNVDLWVRVESESELTVSRTTTFDDGTTFPMFGQTYLTGPNSAAFIAGAQFVDESFATIQGTARFDPRTGRITSILGTFIQFGVFEAGCFSSGNFKSQRVGSSIRG